MSNLTLDDYRRVLCWAGWKPEEFSSFRAWSHDPTYSNSVQECDLLNGDIAALLLLDYSVLEKVRADETLAAKLADHLAALVMPTSYAEDALLSYVLRGEPGCVTRAAIAAGLVPTEEKRDAQSS